MADARGDAVHQALESLYDNAALAVSPLCGDYAWVGSLSDPAQRAQSLRSLLMDAIEALRPPWRSPAHSQPARDYEVLSLRYVSGFTVDQIAAQLCVGSRQVYRDLRRAEARLAVMLHSQARQPPLTSLLPTETPSPPTGTSSVPGVASATIVDLRDIVAAAVRAVTALAVARGSELVYVPPAAPVLTRGAIGLLRTAVTELISAAVQSGGHSTTISLACEAGEPRVAVTLPAGPAESVVPERLAGAHAAGLAVRTKHLPGGRCQLIASLPAPDLLRVCVVEDEPATRDLFARYLEGSGWQPSFVGEGSRAVETVRATRPNAVVLDVMMEDLDGWSILEELRLDPQTSDIPVIVCSVVHDPGLAGALGASACVAKPVSRSQLLAALRQCQRH